MRSALEGLSMPVFSDIQLMATTLLQTSASATCASVKLAMLEDRNLNIRSLVETWNNGLWQAIRDLDSRIQSLCQQIADQAKREEHAVQSDALADVLCVVKGFGMEQYQSDSVLNIREMLRICFDEMKISEIFHSETYQKLPGWKSSSSLLSVYTNDENSAKFESESNLLKEPFNELKNSDISQPFSNYSFNLVPKDKQSKSPRRWNEIASGASKDNEHISNDSQVGPFTINLQKMSLPDRQIPSTDNPESEINMKVSIIETGDDNHNGHTSQISYLTSCSRLVNAGVYKCKKEGKSQDPFYRSSDQRSTHALVNYGCPHDVGLDGFGCAIMAETCCKANWSLGKVVIYLLDREKKLKMYSIKDTKLSLVQEIDISDHQVLALVRSTDELLLQNIKDKSIFTFCSMYSGKYCKSLTPFHNMPIQSSSIFKNEVLMNLNTFDEDRCCILANSSGDVVLIGLESCNIRRVINDFWLGRRSDFKKSASTPDASVVLGGFRRADTYFVIVHDFRKTEKLEKVININGLIEQESAKTTYRESKLHKYDTDEQLTVLDLEIFTECTDSKMVTLVIVFVKMRHSYCLIVTELTDDCYLNIINKTEFEFSEESTVKLKKDRHCSKFAVFSSDMVYLVTLGTKEIVTTKLDLPNQMTDILGLFLLSDRVFLILEKAVIEIGVSSSEYTSSGYRSNATLTLTTLSDQTDHRADRTELKGNSCWWDIQTDREGIHFIDQENIDPQLLGSQMSNKLKKYQKPKEKEIPKLPDTDREGGVITFGDDKRRPDLYRKSSRRSETQISTDRIEINDYADIKRRPTIADRQTGITENEISNWIHNSHKSDEAIVLPKITLSKTTLIAKEDFNGSLNSILWDPYKEMIYFGGEKINLMKYAGGKAKIGSRSFEYEFIDLKITAIGAMCLLLKNARQVVILNEKYHLIKTLGENFITDTYTQVCKCKSPNNKYLWQSSSDKFTVLDLVNFDTKSIPFTPSKSCSTLWPKCAIFTSDDKFMAISEDSNQSSPDVIMRVADVLTADENHICLASILPEGSIY